MNYSLKHWNYFNNHLFFVFTFLSVQFKYSSVQHCVFIKFCMFLAFIPHPISSFRVICFILLITQTPAGSNFFSERFKLSGVDCTLTWTQDGEKWMKCNRWLICWVNLKIFLCNISSMRCSVSSPDETPRREVKICWQGCIFDELWGVSSECLI